MLTIEEKIARSEHFAKLCGQAEIPEWQEEHRQLAAWLRELQECRKAPKIMRCGECRFNDGTAYCVFHFRDVKGNDFCSWAERRTDADD